MNLRIVLLSFLSLLLLLILGVSFYFQKEINSRNNIKDSLLIKIENGSSPDKIGDDLAKVGVIGNKRIFVLAFRIYQKKVHPGYYEIAPKTSIGDIIAMINAGKTKTMVVTFPEGWRVEQIARKLNKEGILDYSGFLAEAAPFEGKLFPDTYYFEPKMTPAAVIKMMMDNYNQKVSGLDVSENDLILASIIEREAGNDEERALISGVYTNRLEIGMKMEADPTVQYGKDTINLAKLSAEAQADYDFWGSVSFADYRGVKSPYNTYLIDSLPPKPICNPGLKSIEAAKSPQKNSYLYFLQYDGKLYPSKTLAEHNQYRQQILGQK